MILPGFPRPMGSKKDPLKNYTPALAAITNKTLLLRADKITGVSNGGYVNSWANEGSAGGAFNATSSYTFNTGGPNGFPYVRQASVAVFSGSMNLGSIKPTGHVGTYFFALRMPATLPSVGILLDDSVGAFDMRYFTATGLRFVCSNEGNSWTPGVFVTAGQDMVVAFRISSVYSQRMNMSGSISTGSVNMGSAPNTAASNVRMAPNDSTNTARIYEVIASSIAVSDAAMDAMVVGLMEKWGMT